MKKGTRRRVQRKKKKTEKNGEKREYTEKPAPKQKKRQPNKYHHLS